MRAVISSSLGIYCGSTTFSTIANYELNPLLDSDCANLSFKFSTSLLSYAIWSLSVMVYEFRFAIRVLLRVFPRNGLLAVFSFALFSIISRSLLFSSLDYSRFVRRIATSACKLSKISFYLESYIFSTGISYVLLYCSDNIPSHWRRSRRHSSTYVFISTSISNILVDFIFRLRVLFSS